MKLIFFVINLLLITLSFVYCHEPVIKNPLRKTNLGRVKGHYKKSFKGRYFQAYEGIPYAFPPVGKLRFKDPKPIEPWEGTLLTTRPGSSCIQYTHVPKNLPERVEGSEDCLYLNIYVPGIISLRKTYPVIFVIHGGAFQFGEGYTYGPEYIIDKNVIVVNFNYRLGPFGFLSTGDKQVPGNMGLKDQSMALKWVSDHIEKFGGDPKKITLVGLSAGGVSVHYHYLSPLSQGLFQRGISFSGSTLNCWAQTENAPQKTKQLANILGCPTKPINKMINCLMTRPAKSISQSTKEFMPWLYNPYTPFGPVVDKSSKKPFLDKSPIDKIELGEVADVPWIATLTSEEGLYPAAEFVADENLINELNDKWTEIAPHLLDYNFTLSLEHHVPTAEKIKKHYMGSNPISKKHLRDLVHMLGDRLFSTGVEKGARLMAKVKKTPVWFYFYSYRGPFSLSDVYTKTNEDFGVSHGDDFLLVFRDPNDTKVVDKTALEMQNKLMDIVVSFATDGKPKADVLWKKVNPSSESLDYLHIAHPDDIQMKEHDNLAEKNFWNTISFDENQRSEYQHEEL